MSGPGNGTNINTTDAAGFSNRAMDIQQHMQSLLGKTQGAVQDAVSPAVWQGSASTQFAGVTERYNTAAKKLQTHMQDILELVKQGAQQFDSKEEANKASIGSAGASLNL
ncbi:WXG100 family type VII secretion target [Williamsia sp. M5A3_1d]